MKVGVPSTDLRHVLAGADDRERLGDLERLVERGRRLAGGRP
jgi:hypothetical protein